MENKETVAGLDQVEVMAPQMKSGPLPGPPVISIHRTNCRVPQILQTRTLIQHGFFTKCGTASFGFCHS
jgi:hypothetical protein